MAFGTRYGYALVVAAILGISASPTAVQQPPAAERALPDFDIRAGRRPAAPPAGAVAALRQARDRRGDRAARVHPHTGALRVLERPAGALPPGTAGARGAIQSLAGALALDTSDLAALTLVRDYTTASTGVRTVAFTQSIDGVPVFDAVVTVHAAADGSLVRVTSGAGRAAGRQPRTGAAPPAGAVAVWFPIDGVLRLAWHSVVESETPRAVYDVLADATTGELLFRRNRVRYADGSGRVIQSQDTFLRDPRMPDQMPLGVTGPGGCPPPVNHLVRSLSAPFRDPATVLGNTGRLAGNNTHVYRGAAPTEGAAGTYDGNTWSFDFPFGSASGAETALFFTMNFVHDFFYDLGFDEAAGNFQLQNFARGGAQGDPVLALARADGRNNAYYQHATDGTSPTIAMFLWDGSGCWSQDVDGDGTQDLDGDHDSDIIIHEFHHGVSLRLNTAWSGDEAAAIGEGGGDFFAYSINGDTVLADYSRAGGIRGVNLKTYADWSCPFWFFCEEHANGEIWANALWDVLVRFGTDLVGGNETAAIRESQQIYIDALKLSPPAPTMLDMRDAMLLADSLRNPGSPRSANFCRIWEPFAARGMGVSATDTADNGMSQVVAAFDVPEGCQGPPPPPTLTVSVVTATATEAGPTNGVFRISRDTAQSAAVSVGYWVAGSAANGTDYVTLAGSATIPANAIAVDVAVVPIDDTLLESNETVVLSLKASTTYVIGTPGSGTVSIVSDDIAPDLVVTSLAATRNAGAGGTVVVTDTTRNQGEAASPVSTTSYYLSKNTLLDTSDVLLGGRDVPQLAPGASDSGSATITIPGTTEAGSYTLFARADGPQSIVELLETNNTRTTTIQVGPDLSVTAVSGPQAAPAGGTIAVSDTTTNGGGGAAAASLTRFYLSANYALDSSDVALQGRSVGALGAGAASSGSTSVTVPPSTGAGLYYVIAKADAEASVPEALETNNTRSFLLRVGADLTITSLVAPSQVASGATLAIGETTTNSGAGTAAASRTALYLSSNYSFDSSDLRLSDGRAVPQLAAGAWSSGSTTVTLPQLAVGTWYIIARADDGLAVPEAYENNNTRTAVLNVGPDLTMASFTVPTTGVSGSTIVVNHTVKNSGAQEAATASVIKFYLSTNSTFDAADIDLGAVGDTPALAAGASFAGSTTLSIPPDLSGTFFIVAVADGTKVVPETVETNNATARGITITRPAGIP